MEKMLAFRTMKRYVEKNRVDICLVFSVFLLGFLYYMWIFFRSRLITGVDGPYYLIQVRELFRVGSLVYGDPPLTFYLLAFFSLLLGDIMLGVKVGVSFFCALSTIPVFFLMKRVGKGRLAGFFAMLLVVFSAPYIRMMTDFMKNAVGICWLLAFIYYLHDLAFSGLKKRSLAFATFFLVLTDLTHILDFGVALLFLAFYTVLATIFDVNRRSFLMSAGIMALVVGVFVFLAAVFFGSLFTDFNKVLSFIYSLTSPQGIGTQPPQQPPPPRHPGHFPRPPFAPAIPFSIDIVGGWGVILLILFFGASLSLYLWKKREKEAFLLLTITTSMGSIMCFPLIPNEWLGRFLLMMVVPTAIILSYGLSKMNEILNRNSKFNVSSVLVVVCLTFFVVQAGSIAVNINPTITYVEYLDLVNMKSHIPPDSIIAVPHGMYYWVQYIDEVDVGQLSPDLWQSYSHVLGLFFKGNVPPVPFNQTIFVGNILILVELQPPPKPLSSP